MTRHLPKVDISRSRRSRSFGGEERLWQEDLDRTIDMINDHVKNLERDGFDRGDADGSERENLQGTPHLSLAVFGPAGSGKSSFLKTLVAETRRKERQVDSRLSKVKSLDILQPARFGEEDHLLYATVAAGLNEHQKKNEGQLDYEVLTGVLKAYRDLSGHLRVLRKEPPMLDLEPHALAAEVIQRHSSGLALGKKIDEFLNKLADDLNNETRSTPSNSSVILLPVDDLDLAPQHLFEGLRELQAYLLHPRLIPIFCFTDRLAEEILAGEFAKIVTHADQKRELSGRLSVSEQLAVQYLSKCFPIRNRIRLGPTPATLQSSNLDVSQGKERLGKEPVLWTLITASVLLFGVPDRNARHPVKAVLRPTTLRRQFQIIDAMRQAGVDSLIAPKIVALVRAFSLDDEALDRVPADTWGVLFDRASWALLNVHRDVLREYGMYLEDLYSWAPHALRRVILDSLFQLPSKSQSGLWQRWRTLTNSRRSQIISLLAANAFRPWLNGERASGEDLPQLALVRREQRSANTSWCRCETRCTRETREEANAATTSRSSRSQDRTRQRLCKIEQQVLSAPTALQWFLDLVLGFYLPLSRSVFRHLRSGKVREKEPLSGAGWTFETAPILAAHAADDDRKLFPTGMLFLDPFSFATALTTSPRIAACRVLDEQTVSDKDWDLVKQIKIAFLITSTKSFLQARGETLFPELSDNVKVQAESLLEVLSEAEKAYRNIAAWESGKKNRKFESPQPHSLLKNAGPSEESTAGELRKALEKHDYSKAEDLIIGWNDIANINSGEDLKDEKKKKNELIKLVAGLKAAATAVHDDQLLLRIWTCYGYNRGRFWAAVSLWRGLGLMGQLIESYRRWCAELSNLSSDEQRTRQLVYRIAGILRSHSSRGLVPGRDLGEPSHQGTLELAFSGWNAPGQHKATLRLAERLCSWLETNGDFSIAPLQDHNMQWGQCFLRRLHGNEVVGALWRNLDSEHLEHQGNQYGKRRSYYWNAGVALTSWLRVLQQFFGGALEIRWLLETCPLTSPFLSHSAQDTFLAMLCDKPYAHLLMHVAEHTALHSMTATEKAPRSEKPLPKGTQEETEDNGQPSDVAGTTSSLERSDRPLLRDAKRFREMTLAIQDWWQKEAFLIAFGELAGYSEDDQVEAEGIKTFTRKQWVTIAKKVLQHVLQQPLDVDAEFWRNFFPISSDPSTRKSPERRTRESLEKTLDIAKSVREEVFGIASSGTAKKEDITNYIDRLLSSFNPGILEPGYLIGRDDTDEDRLDPRSAAFEIASMVQQHWKVTAHASAASLLYQIPRLRRVDFFDQDGNDSVKVDVSGELGVNTASSNGPQSPPEESPPRPDPRSL